MHFPAYPTVAVAAAAAAAAAAELRFLKFRSGLCIVLTRKTILFFVHEMFLYAVDDEMLMVMTSSQSVKGHPFQFYSWEHRYDQRYYRGRKEETL